MPFETVAYIIDLLLPVCVILYVRLELGPERTFKRVTRYNSDLMLHNALNTGVRRRLEAAGIDYDPEPGREKAHLRLVRRSK